MAENKKSFVLYADLLKVVEQLPDEIAGKLFKIILAYVNDNEVEINDILLKIAFEPIKLQLKRDLQKWDVIKVKRSLAGKKSAEVKKQNATNSTSVDFVEHTSTKSTVNDNVNVTVNVNDNVNVNDILLEKETKNKNSFNFKKKLIEYGFEENLVDDWLKVRKTKKATNTETAFKAFISEIERKTCNINEMLFICVQNSWSGFKHSWVENLNNQKTNGASRTNTEVFQQSVIREVARNFKY